MLLQVLIIKDQDTLPELLSGFLAAGIGGSTVVDCQGALQILGHSDVDEPPIFGTLRQFLNPDSVSGKLILTVLSDGMITKARDIVHQVIGDLSNPGTGILFTLPISNVEGLAK